MSYLGVCVATCAVRGIACGTDSVAVVIGPVLDAFYPSTIVITFYYCFVRDKYRRTNLLALRWTILVSIAMALSVLVSTYASLFGLTCWRLRSIRIPPA